MADKEKYIIDQLKDHRESVDMDDLWMSIADDIPQSQRKKRRAGFWIWSGLVGLLLLIIGAAIVYRSANQHTSSRDISNAVSNSMSSSLTPIMAESMDNLPELERQKLAQKNQEAENLTLINRKSKEINGATNTILKNESHGGTSTEIKIHPEDNISEIIEKENESHTHTNYIINTGEQIDHEMRDDQSQQPIKKEIDVKTDSASEVNENPAVTIPMLNFNAGEELRYDRKLRIPVVNHLPIVDLEKEKVYGRRWSLIAAGFAGVVDRNLSTTDNESKTIIERRDDIESVRGSWGATLGVGYRFSVALRVSSGISMYNIYEQSAYTTSYTIENVANKNTIIHTQDGAVNSINQNVSVYTNRETNEIRNNRYRLISIPIVIEYRLWEDDLYRIDVSARGEYAIAQGYKGFTSFDINSPAYDLDIDEASLFSQGRGLSYGLGLQMTRYLSTDVGMSVGIDVRKLSNLTTSDNTITQEYTMYGISLGIQYKL